MNETGNSLLADAYINNSRSANDDAWGEYLRARAFNERLGAVLGVGLLAAFGGFFALEMSGAFHPTN